ncbi:MAG: hypothetical protein GF387_01830 [Candidatus Portnoybacteria bacterium]|nr:hypothetical protein [Candidatus Portnoybacteria bacterium]
MRNIFSLHVETKVSLAIILIVIVIFLITIFKSIDNFNKFNDRINQYDQVLKERPKQ